MKKLFYSLVIKPVSDMKLPQKMLFFYLLVIIAPLVVFSFVSSNKASAAIESLVKYSAGHSFQQSAAFISYKIQKVMDASRVLLTDTRINNILIKDPELYDIHEQLQDMKDLSSLLSSFPNKDEISDVKLYINDAFMYSNEGVNLLSINSILNTQWYQELSTKKTNILWVPSLRDSAPTAGTTGADPKELTSLIRNVYDTNNYLNTVGMLRIDILQEKLLEILKNASPTKNSITYIINTKNEIISSSSPVIRDEQIPVAAFSMGNAASGSYFDTYYIKNEKYLLSSQRISNTDWIMVSLTPYNEILAVSKNIKYEILLIFLLIGVAAYSIANLISYSMTKRIRMLIRNMNNIQNGNFSNVIVSDSKDEIGELITNFNSMSKRLSFLVNEQFRIGQEMKNSELIALQAQINPHFLYNTLNLINWSAINNNVPEISQTVQALSRFFKLSLSKGSNIIPIRDEIEHVKLYLDIQNRRYENAFTFEIDISEEIYRYSTIKIILQPLIENAIIHGILQKDKKKGLITLTGCESEGIITLTVKDDGIGMSEEDLGNILSIAREDSLHGYGVRNINERIKLYYGESYGLSYQSTPGEGTLVKIRFPVSTTRPEA